MTNDLLQATIARLGKNELFDQSEQGEFICKRCGAPAELQSVCFSLHSNIFGDRHAGGGDVRHIQVPWCSGCGDTKPASSGCIHTDDELSVEAVYLGVLAL